MFEEEITPPFPDLEEFIQKAILFSPIFSAIEKNSEDRSNYKDLILVFIRILSKVLEQIFKEVEGYSR